MAKALEIKVKESLAQLREFQKTHPNQRSRIQMLVLIKEESSKQKMV